MLNKRNQLNLTRFQTIQRPTRRASPNQLFYVGQRIKMANILR